MNLSLTDRLEQHENALTAAELAKLLNMSRITIFKKQKPDAFRPSESVPQ